MNATDDLYQVLDAIRVQGERWTVWNLLAISNLTKKEREWGRGELWDRYKMLNARMKEVCARGVKEAQAHKDTPDTTTQATDAPAGPQHEGGR